ncbi:MAG: hypothetical protein M3O71_14120 [Bacteroidota bacterium]|nr:hypothetical protein [Bacteroidota bacterium]
MNNVFNLKRFGRLFKKQFSEHYKTYLMALSVLLGVMLVGGSFLVYLIGEPIDLGMQVVLFVVIFYLAGTIFTSTIFADTGNHTKAIAYFTLPASHFEKFLVGWLFSYVIFTLVYTGSFYLILLFLLNIKHWPNQHITVLNIFSGQTQILFIAFSLLHSISIWGAIFFKRLHFIKTAFCFFISVVMLTLVNTSFIESMVGREVRPATPFSNIMFYENNRNIAVAVSRHDDTLIFWILVSVTVVFWVAAYYRLKERQV